MDIPKIPLKDVEFTPYRIEGQGVNEDPLGCRATHKPTGVYVDCSEYTKCFRCNQKASYARLKKKLKEQA